MNKAVQGDRLEDAVWDEIAALLLEPDNLSTGYEELRREHQVELERQREELAEIEARLTKLRERQQNLTLAYADPDISLSKEEYLLLRAQAQSDIDVVRQQKRKVQKQLAQRTNRGSPLVFADFQADIRAMLRADAELTDRQRRKVLDLLDVRIVIYPDSTLEINGWLNSQLLDETSRLSGSRSKTAM